MTGLRRTRKRTRVMISTASEDMVEIWWSQNGLLLCYLQHVKMVMACHSNTTLPISESQNCRDIVRPVVITIVLGIKKQPIAGIDEPWKVVFGRALKSESLGMVLVFEEECSTEVIGLVFDVVCQEDDKARGGGRREGVAERGDETVPSLGDALGSCARNQRKSTEDGFKKLRT
ncbi:hypothetical protein LOK49_Contig124G00003 [Camellia lanceoleosa]|nr:hypothetical protein LOK49_Contig124G00003 [Camellia lanceoleosa]